MKMRKILSFVLVLSLVLGSFSMAFAATPATSLSDIAGIANEDAIQVNNDLGIIKGFPDGTFLPEKAVNRAEFAAMITRALAVPESALAGYTSTTFKDTAGYGWAVPYLAFAQSKGILIGDGMGNVMPGRTINVNEAMTMVLRAIGYVNHSAELVGTWPSNYVTVAQNVGLYDDVAASVTVDRANAAQIIYNALTVQKVSVNADGETKYLTLSGTTEPAVLMNTGLGAEAVTGVVGLTINKTWNINEYDYLGVRGTAYVNSDDEVVAFTAKSTDMTGKVSSDGTKFTVNGKDYSLKSPLVAATTYAAFDNGVLVKGGVSFGAITGTAVVTVNGTFSGSYITAIDSLVYWTINDADIVTSSDLDDLDDNKFMGHKFAENDDDAIDTNSFVLVGAASLEDIKAGDLAYVYKNGPEIVKIAVSNKEVTGKITRYSAPDFTIDGTKYKLAAVATERASGSFFKTTIFSESLIGTDVTITLDAYGFVYEIEGTEKVDKYAIVVEYSNSLSDQVKAFTAAAGDNEVYTLTSDAEKNHAWGNGTASVGALFAYSLDKDGKIDAIDVTNATGVVNATFTGVRTVTFGGASHTIADDAVVFVATGSSLTTGFDMGSLTKITLNKATTISAILDESKVVAMVVHEGVADKDSDDVYGVINSKSLMYNSDEDDTFLFLEGFIDGAAFAKYTNSASTAATKGAFELAKIVYDGDGLIKSANAVTTFATTTYAKLDAGTTTTVLNDTYTIANTAVVYEFDDVEDEFSVSKVNAIRGTVQLYDLDNDVDGYDIVIFKASNPI